MRIMQHAILAVALLMGGPLRASIINITLDNDTLMAVPGGSVTFSGVVQNTNANAVDLNVINVNVDGTLFQLDVTPFFLGPPSVAGASSTASFGFFSVTVNSPYLTGFGLQSGSLTVLGGVQVGGVSDPTAQDILGSASFTINVQDPGPGNPAIPEPSTAGTVLAAIGAGVVMARRRCCPARQSGG